MPTTILWSDEELEATVDAYADVLTRKSQGENTVRANHYRALSLRFGRLPSAYRRRFNNISHVLISLGLARIPGMGPLDHMGTRVENTIRQVVLRRNLFGVAAVVNQPNSPTSSRPPVPRPAGNRQPPRRQVMVEQTVRDSAVVNWVLEQATGHCECCGQPAPFLREDGTPYLEVHHVKWLAKGGSDTVSNAVALCPNCHRQLHHGAGAAGLVAQLVLRVERLVAE